MTTRLGPYIVKETIGSGSFAEVKLAVHEETQRKVAIKVFDRRKISFEEFQHEVRNEVKIMQFLRHPNIVAVEQVLMSETNMYIVMELVEGGELYYEIVKKKRLNEKTARKYFQQLVDAMVYCHKKGVYHRDLKPENVLIDHEDNIKITDFGMSRMKEHFDAPDELMHTQCGTPKYMAPEVIIKAKQGYHGDKVDVWDCAMVLYAMLAGYLPFNGSDDRAVFRQIVFGKIKYPKWFSDPVCELLSHMLEKDPTRRWDLKDLYHNEWFMTDYQGVGMGVFTQKSSRDLAHRLSRDSNASTKSSDKLGVAHKKNLKDARRPRSSSNTSLNSGGASRSSSRSNSAGRADAAKASQLKADAEVSSNARKAPYIFDSHSKVKNKQPEATADENFSPPVTPRSNLDSNDDSPSKPVRPPVSDSKDIAASSEEEEKETEPVPAQEKVQPKVMRSLPPTANLPPNLRVNSPKEGPSSSDIADNDDTDKKAPNRVFSNLHALLSPKHWTPRGNPEVPISARGNDVPFFSPGSEVANSPHQSQSMANLRRPTPKAKESKGFLGAVENSISFRNRPSQQVLPKQPQSDDIAAGVGGMAISEVKTKKKLFSKKK